MLTERDAIERAKENDLSGLQMLVKLHQEESIRLVTLIVQDIQLAEDIVIDCFLKAFERMDQFDKNRPFFPWFRRILVNDALKRISHRNRLLSLDSVDDERSAETSFLDSLSLMPDPSDLAELAEMKNVVRKAIHSLAPKQRAVIVLRYYYDLSESEIADTLGIPGGTVKSRAATGIRRLNDLLSNVRSSFVVLFW